MQEGFEEPVCGAGYIEVPQEGKHGGLDGV